MQPRQARPGARNLITDVLGLKVGQAWDARVRTGVTVILPDRPATAACDVRGGGPGTRETDALAAENLVDAVDAIVLSGGSVYGLAAADGVAAWLGERGLGYVVTPSPGVPPSPIVPAAILYDLANGGDKAWGRDPPYRRLGIEAIETASEEFALGTVGAGFGAMAGTLKGGVGSASIVTADAITVGAVAAVNSFGSVTAPGGRAFWAAPFELNAEFGGVPFAACFADSEDWGRAKPAHGMRSNTTIACVATDVALTPAQARRVAIMAQDGLARAIPPVHTPFDGDVVFALSTGAQPLAQPANAAVSRIGSLAADCLARAVARGVFGAAPWAPGEPICWGDLAR